MPSGLRVYATDNFELQTNTTEDDISLVEQLFSTSLVAVVLTPRLLRIVNTKVRQAALSMKDGTHSKTE